MDIIEKIIKEPLYEMLLSDIRDMNDRGSRVFPAFRKNRIDFYYRGGKLFSYGLNGFSTHNKYASVIERFVSKGGVEISVPEVISSDNVGNCRLLTDFSSEKAYKRIKENCFMFSGGESEARSYLISRESFANTSARGNRYVALDIELSLDAKNRTEAVYDDGAPAKEEGQDRQDRIDLVMFDKWSRILFFYEIKLFSNKELWAKSGANPAVVKQINRYNRQLSNKVNSECILSRYIKYVETGRTLFDLSDDDLPSPEGICPDARLLVIGYDGLQMGKINELLLRDGSLNQIVAKFRGGYSDSGFTGKSIFHALKYGEGMEKAKTRDEIWRSARRNE